MSDSDSGETIYTDSDRSEDSDSEDSLKDFIAEETTPQKFKGIAEIDQSNIVLGKRKRFRRISNDILTDTSSDDSDYV
jgi:hypothetical protein